MNGGRPMCAHGLTDRAFPRKAVGIGGCRICAREYARRYRGKVRAGPLDGIVLAESRSWRCQGWISRHEMVFGLRTAKTAKTCEGCGTTNARTRSGVFCADHSDLRKGGDGRFRGATCDTCNKVLGYFESGWPLLPDALRDYLDRAANRVPLSDAQEDMFERTRRGEAGVFGGGAQRIAAAAEK